MTKRPAAAECGRYEIRVQGHLDPRWAVWFEGLTLTTADDGTSVLDGVVVDQAALHGLLVRVRDIGLPLISVIKTSSDFSASTMQLPSTPASQPTHPPGRPR